jgi:hypothetical protein
MATDTAVNASAHVRTRRLFVNFRSLSSGLRG